MTLSERIQAQSCAVVGCDRHRVKDSLVCADHLNEMFANRLDRQPDGTFVPRLPEWRRRLVAKDFTGSVA